MAYEKELKDLEMLAWMDGGDPGEGRGPRFGYVKGHPAKEGLVTCSAWVS